MYADMECSQEIYTGLIFGTLWTTASFVVTANFNLQAHARGLL